MSRKQQCTLFDIEDHDNNCCNWRVPSFSSPTLKDASRTVQAVTMPRNGITSDNLHRNHNDKENEDRNESC